MPRKIQGRSWLDAYIEYVAETEAPDNYKVWCGLTALGATLKRNVFMRRGRYKIFPNQYVVLVGPPGIGKGVAMNDALELVKTANTAHFIEDRATAERVQELLATGFQSAITTPAGTLQMGIDHCAYAVAPELSVFLGASEWSLQFFCSLWDKNEFSYDTKKNKNITIRENCFGLLGACTPDYIRKLNKDSMAAIGGGFTSRTIFAFANKKSRSIPWPSDTTHISKDDLVNDLKYMALLKGDFKFTNEAKKKFTDFYTANDSIADTFESEVLTNFRARMPSHILKNAILLSISESDSLLVEEHHIDTAMNLVFEIFKTLDITFRGVGESDLAEATDRVMKFIEARGKIAVSRTEILRANIRHITDEDLSRVLYTLKTIGFCIETFVGSQIMYQYNTNFTTQQKIIP